MHGGKDCVAGAAARIVANREFHGHGIGGGAQAVVPGYSRESVGLSEHGLDRHDDIHAVHHAFELKPSESLRLERAPWYGHGKRRDLRDGFGSRERCHCWRRPG